MTSEIEMDDLREKRSVPQSDTEDKHKGGRLNMDADQEQAVTLWGYAATVL